MKTSRYLKVIAFIFCVFQVLVPNTYAAEDYSLEVESNYRITWDITSLDSTLLEYIKNNCDSCLTTLINLDIKKGSTISYQINSITEYDDYWDLDCESSLDSESSSTSIISIYIDPKNVPENYLYEFIEDEIRILPIDIEDYIHDLAKISSSLKNVTVTSSNNILNVTYVKNNNKMSARFEYRDDGIIQEFEFFYNNETALKYEFSDYAKVSDDTDIMLIIIIVIVIMIAFFVSIALLSKISKKQANKLKTKPQPFSSQINNQVSPATREVNSGPVKSNLSPSTQNTNLRALYEKYEIFDDDEDIIKYIREKREKYVKNYN